VNDQPAGPIGEDTSDEHPFPTYDMGRSVVDPKRALELLDEEVDAELAGRLNGDPPS
jgi:hypothetical protein